MHPDALKPVKIGLRFVKSWTIKADPKPARLDWYFDWRWIFRGGGE